MSRTLGQRIREIRMKKGLTQIELSKGLITPSMISQIESDKARPSYQVLVAIATRLDVQLEQLLKGVNIELEYSSKYKMAIGMVRAKEFEAAIPLLEDLVQSKAHRIPKENLHLELALCFLELGDSAGAENELTLLLQLVTNGQKEKLVPVVLLYLGKAAAMKSEIPIAFFHTNRAWEELQKAEEIEADLHVKVLMQLATLYEKVGKASEAAKYFEKVLQFNQEDSEERAKTYLRLAEVYDRQKKFEQAEEYATKAHLLLEEHANKKQLQDLKHRMIMLQRGVSDWKLSVQKLLSIAEQYEREGDKQKFGEVCVDISLVCIENQEFDEASAYAEQARMSLPDTSPAMGKVHRVLSSVYFHRNEEEKGGRHLDNAVKIYERHGMVKELEEVTLFMCRHLSEKGDHLGAFRRMEQFHHAMIGQLEQRGIVL